MRSVVVVSASLPSNASTNRGEPSRVGQRAHGDARSPHDPAGYVAVDALLAWWTGALRRTVHATTAGAPVDGSDYWTELAVGTRLAREVTAGRWVVVARLLRASAIRDWCEVGTALDMTGPAAAAGFAEWLVGQVVLCRQTGIGVTPAEAEDLARLADAVSGGGLR